MLRFLPAASALALAMPQATAEEPARLVFQNGRSVPIIALALQGPNLVVTGETEGFSVGQTFPAASIDHVFGEKPESLNKGIAMLLLNKPKEARDLLEPVYNAHRITAKVPGNFWIEAARALLVSYAVTGDSKRVTELGKEISDATPAQGIDPFVSLGKTLLMPAITTKLEDRDIALKDLLTENQPADARAYASYFRGLLLRDGNKQAEALDAFLSIPTLYPTGGLILNAAAEIQAADLLLARGSAHRDEATALVKSALRVSEGTLVADESKKRLESLK